MSAIKEKLDTLHEELIGTGSNSWTDLDKIIEIIVILAEKVEELEGHTHSFRSA